MYAEKHAEITEEISKKTEERLGIVPNLIKQLSLHPLLAKVYADGMFLFQDKGVLTPEEQQVLYLYISNYNDCHYCKVAHSFSVKREGKLSEAQMEDLKNDKPTGNQRYDQLIEATRWLLEKRGKLSRADLQHLASNGIDQLAIYEIIGLIALKTISNYTNYIARTIVDFPLS